VIKPVRLDSMVFMPELMKEVFSALGERRTVLTCTYQDRSDGRVIELELRVKKHSGLRMPATRTGMDKKPFMDRVVELNARDYTESKGACRPKPPVITRTRKR